MAEGETDKVPFLYTGILKQLYLSLELNHGVGHS